jgi:hypothetical protein
MTNDPPSRCVAGLCPAAVRGRVPHPLFVPELFNNLRHFGEPPPAKSVRLLVFFRQSTMSCRVVSRFARLPKAVARRIDLSAACSSPSGACARSIDEAMPVRTTSDSLAAAAAATLLSPPFDHNDHRPSNGRVEQDDRAPRLGKQPGRAHDTHAPDPDGEDRPTPCGRAARRTKRSQWGLRSDTTSEAAHTRQHLASREEIYVHECNQDQGSYAASLGP